MLASTFALSSSNLSPKSCLSEGGNGGRGACRDEKTSDLSPLLNILWPGVCCLKFRTGMNT